jgi:hypothetical protein
MKKLAVLSLLGLLAVGAAACDHTQQVAAVVHGRLRAFDVDHLDDPELLAILREVDREYRRFSSKFAPGKVGGVGSRRLSGMELLAIKERAGKDFGCSASDVDIVGYERNCVALVAGCGHEDVYLRMTLSEITRSAPRKPGEEVLLDTSVYSSIATPLTAAKEELRRLAPPPDGPQRVSVCGDPEDVPRSFEGLVAIHERAARDLRCPASEVMPHWLPANPSPDHEHAAVLAEGCGRRATYDYTSGMHDAVLWEIVEILPRPPPPELTAPSGP